MVIVGNSKQVAQILFRRGGNINKDFTAVTHLHHRHAAALKIEHFFRGLRQHFRG